VRQRTRELKDQGDRLDAARYPILTLWQTLCENFHVMRADYTRARYISEEFASYMMTGRPAMAFRDLSNSFGTMLRPRDQQWLHARTSSEQINSNPACRTYLDQMSATMRRAMYDRRAKFLRATAEGDGDYCSIGQCVISCEMLPTRDGLIFRCWHPRDVVWAENSKLDINRIFRKWKPQCFELKETFPKTVDPKVDELIKQDPFRQIDCRHIILPSDDYDLSPGTRGVNGLVGRKQPFVSIYIDCENDTILEETFVRTSTYVIPRWATISGSQYAYSPAALYALPDSRMLQQITLTLLEAAQKSVDPPMLGVGEAINGGTNLFAGGMTWTDADYDERTGEVLRPLSLEFRGLEFGAKREEKIEAAIDNAWYLNKIRMPEVTKEMTAYETRRVYEEFIRQNLPLFEPISAEYNGGLCDMVFEQLQPMGAFGSIYDMPPMLRGQQFHFEFDTPLQEATEMLEVQDFQQTMQIATEAAQADPSVMDDLDVAKGARDAMTASGGSKWLRSPDAAAKLRQQRQQQAAAQAAATQVANGVDTATRVAAAAKSAGAAATALQGAGVGA
jgi:hypothetical protein